MADLARKYKNSEKKSVCVASAVVEAADAEAALSNLLFNLPDDALIISAGVVVEVAGQGGLTVDFGFAGGNELGNDLAVSSTGYKQAVTVQALTGNAENINITPAPRLLTGTGKDVTAKFSAQPSAGRFVFIVEFIEYKLGSGKLLSYTEGA